MLDSGEVVAAFTGLGDERWIDFKVPQGLAKISVGDEASLYDLDGAFLGSATVVLSRTQLMRALARLM